MPRYPGAYDESIMLVGAMRVAAGQIPYRDFYAIYGPAEFYIYAALFKLFGPSILAARLFDISIESLTIVSVFAITRLHASRAVSIGAAVVTLLWLYGLDMTTGAAVVPVCLINLVATALLLPVFAGHISQRRLYGIGALAGVALLFRLDAGIALAAVHACLIATAVLLQPKPLRRLPIYMGSLWRYAVGFGAVILLPFLYFLSVSRLHPLLLDVFILQKKYYHRYRNLPFPHVGFRSLESDDVYLPLIVAAFALVMVFHLKQRSDEQLRTNPDPLSTFLMTFGLLAFAMFFKGAIRVNMLHMYLAIIPATVVIAVILQHRAVLPRPLRRVAILTGCLFLYMAILPALRERKTLLAQGTVTQRLIDVAFFPERAKSSFDGAWCGQDSPLTRGFCFRSDESRLETAMFIESHTRPDQRLLDATTRHDKIFVNDNLVYFAAQRLPATSWSEYDAGVQTSYEVQAAIVRDLEATEPPYIIRDSEFEKVHEPNDSSKSTGITLLDSYIEQHYRFAQAFGEMAVWQRNP